MSNYVTQTGSGAAKTVVGWLAQPYGQITVTAWELKGTQATAAVTFRENAKAAGTVTTGAAAGTTVKLANTAAVTACGAVSGAYVVIEHLGGGGVGTWEAKRIATITGGKVNLSASTTYSVYTGDKLYVTNTAVASALVSVATVRAAGDALVATTKPGRALTAVLVSTSSKVRYITAKLS